MFKGIFGALFLTIFINNFALAMNETDVPHCNNQNGPLTNLLGSSSTNDIFSQNYYDVAPGSIFDGLGSTQYQITDLSASTKNAYPVDIRSNDGTMYTFCVRNHAIWTLNDTLNTWSEDYDINHAGWTHRGGRIHFYRLRSFNNHDSIRPGRYDIDGNGNHEFRVSESWITYNRDDCVEDDVMRGGIVEDNLFDGCYVFMSSRSSGTPTDVSDTREIWVRNNIVRLQGMPGPYGHYEESGGVPSYIGSAGLFKWHEFAPSLRVIGNIFYIPSVINTKYDEDSWIANSSSSLGFRRHTNQLIECRDNIIIWPPEAEARWGSFQDLILNKGKGGTQGLLPEDFENGCVTVTDDVNIYHEARANWIANHPEVPRFSNDPVTVEISCEWANNRETYDGSICSSEERTPQLVQIAQAPPQELTGDLLVTLSNDPTKADGQNLNGLSTDDQDFWIYLNVSDNSLVDYVEFDVTGFPTHVENGAPWDIGPQVYGFGDYAVEARAYGFDGSLVNTFSATFSVVDNSQPPTPTLEEQILNIVDQIDALLLELRGLLN